jgi:hypothetical protein
VSVVFAFRTSRVYIEHTVRSGRGSVKPIKVTAVERHTLPVPDAVGAHAGARPSVNQVEVYFSFAPRKTVSPNDFSDVVDVEQRLAGFEQRYIATSQPFRRDPLARISRHERPDVPGEVRAAA